MERSRSPLLAAALGLALGVGSISVASAQGYGSQSGASQQPMSQPQQQSFSENELKSFALAALKVEQIHKTYQPRMQSAQTTDERIQIREQASTEMKNAVRQQGLSVEKYNQIYAAAQTDPQVAQQIDKHLREAQ